MTLPDRQSKSQPNTDIERGMTWVQQMFEANSPSDLEALALSLLALPLTTNLITA
jgi:hypothetical protein